MQKMRVEPVKRATAWKVWALSPATRARAPFFDLILGLAPQALFCRPFHGLGAHALRYRSASRARRPRICDARIRRLSAAQAQTKVDAGGQVGEVYQGVAVALFLMDGGVAVALVV